MRILLIGGTGLISVGIVRHLLNRGAEVVCFNRGKSNARDVRPLPEAVRQVHGNRDEPGALSKAFEGQRFDAVIDMICFTPKQCQTTIELARQVTDQLLFCSTVCTYGVKIPSSVLVSESFPQEPISEYGRNKLACEQMVLNTHARGDFSATVIRPSHTYGEGAPLIDNLEPDGPAWSRILDDQPVLCAGDGLALWMSTHRDDVGKLFAHAVGNPKVAGKCYNATTDRAFTWVDYYREAADALGKRANTIFMPRDWIVAHDPKRFGLLREITGFHGAYDSSAARRDVPEFECTIGFPEGARRTLDHLCQTNRLRPSDELYEQMVTKALAAGANPIEV